MAKPDLDPTAFIRKWEKMLNDLSEDEMVLLNKMIVDKMKMLQKARELMAASQFHVGEVVAFTGDLGEEIRGRILRINQKTISVEVGDIGYYKVPQQYLRKVQR